MWFVPGSHLEPELRPHRRVKEGHHLRMTDHCSNVRDIHIIILEILYFIAV